MRAGEYGRGIALVGVGCVTNHTSVLLKKIRKSASDQTPLYSGISVVYVGEIRPQCAVSGPIVVYGRVLHTSQFRLRTGLLEIYL